MGRYEKFLSAVREEFAVHPSWRYGQAVFSALWEADQEYATEISGTDLDPFFDGSRCGTLLEKLRERWEGK